METSRVMRAIPLAVAGFMLGMTAAPAHASDAPAGGPALRDARSIWEKGNIEMAEPLYREALEKGGLAPADVLEGYVRLGSIRASLGKKDQAIAAFRAASILDSSFAVPSEAGPKGPALAAQAKKDTQKFGSIQLSMKVPKESASGKSFTVTAQLDGPHIPIVAKFGLVTRDGTSGKEVFAEARVAESADLEVSSDITMPNARLLVRVDALDKNGNRLASVEDRVRIRAPEGAGAGPIAAARAGTSPSGASSNGSSAAGSSSREAAVGKGGSFWSSPWVYVIGGAALAGAGTAIYFGTRPSEQVSVGQVGVRSK